MAHIVVLGAGLGGTIMAYKMKDQLRPGNTLTIVTKEPKYYFVPSNPWIAVGWRKPEEIEVELAPVFAKKGHRLQAGGGDEAPPRATRWTSPTARRSPMTT